MSNPNDSTPKISPTCSTNEAYANMISGMLTFTSAAQEFMLNSTSQAQVQPCHQKLEQLVSTLNESLKELYQCNKPEDVSCPNPGIMNNSSKHKTSSKQRVSIQNSSTIPPKPYTCTHGVGCLAKQCRKCKQESAEKESKKHKSKLPVAKTRARSFDKNEKGGDQEEPMAKSNSEPTNKPNNEEEVAEPADDLNQTIRGDETGVEIPDTTKAEEEDVDYDIFATNVPETSEKREAEEKPNACTCGTKEDECLCDESEACVCDAETECDEDSATNKILLLRELKKKLNVAEKNLMDLQKEISCLSKQMAVNPMDVCKPPGTAHAIYKQIMKTTTSIDELSTTVNNVSPFVKRTITTEEYRRLPPMVPTHCTQTKPLPQRQAPPPPRQALPGYPPQYRPPTAYGPHTYANFGNQGPPYYSNYPSPSKYAPALPPCPGRQPRGVVSVEHVEIREGDSYDEDLCGPCNRGRTR